MQGQNNNQRKARKIVNTFTINDNTFDIILIGHAQDRVEERKIDLFKVIGTILALGEEKIIYYTKNNADVMIHDKENGFSVVIWIEERQIRIQTVIDNANAYAKQGTSVVSL